MKNPVRTIKYCNQQTSNGKTIAKINLNNEILKRQ